MAALAGMITQVNANYELNKNLNVIPQGQLVPRHFRDHEYEFYGQDQWRIKPNLTFTYGLRYSILQPPYETTGTQVAPTVSLHDWFTQRGGLQRRGRSTSHWSVSLFRPGERQAALLGLRLQRFRPSVCLCLFAQGRRRLRQEVVGRARKDLDSRRLRHLFRSLRRRHHQHFRPQRIVRFDHSHDQCRWRPNRGQPRGTRPVQHTDHQRRMRTLRLSEPPPTGPFPVYPPPQVGHGGFAITWGLDDKLKTPYSHVIDFSITRELPSNFVFEASYVGRFAHRLLQEEDLAEPVNLRDPARQARLTSRPRKL